MTDSQPPAPGHDEIIVTVPAARAVCDSREHARLGVLAEVVVAFGDLGTRWQADAVFQDCWGRSFAMCAECWAAARQVAQARRPALVITATTVPAGSPAPHGQAARPSAPLAARRRTAAGV